MSSEEEDEKPEISWSRWYRLARYEAAFRYGLRGIPIDAYKTQWALGDSVQAGVKRIAEFRASYGKQ